MLKKCLYEKPYIKWTFFRKYDYKNSAFFAFRNSFAEYFHRYSAHAIVDKNKDNKTIFLSPNITEPDTGKDFK